MELVFFLGFLAVNQPIVDISKDIVKLAEKQKFSLLELIDRKDLKESSLTFKEPIYQSMVPLEELAKKELKHFGIIDYAICPVMIDNKIQASVSFYRKEKGGWDRETIAYYHGPYLDNIYKMIRKLELNLENNEAHVGCMYHLISIRGFNLDFICCNCPGKDCSIVITLIPIKDMPNYKWKKGQELRPGVVVDAIHADVVRYIEDVKKRQRELFEREK